MGGGNAGLVIVTLAVFLSGVMLGVVGMVSLAVRREERRCTLFGAAPDAMTRGARVLTGFTGCGTNFVQHSGGQQASRPSLLAVVGIIFAVGVTVGVVAVAAVSALRTGRRRHGGPPEQGPGGPSPLAAG